MNGYFVARIEELQSLSGFAHNSAQTFPALTHRGLGSTSPDVESKIASFADSIVQNILKLYFPAFIFCLFQILHKLDLSFAIINQSD